MAAPSRLVSSASTARARARRSWPPNLGGATTAGAVLHALAQQRRQFGFYALTLLLTGGLWSEHHQLLDPLETHGRRLPRVNLWFLLTVSLLPYWVNVLASYPGNNAAAGMFVLWLGVAQVAFMLVCVVVRTEVGERAALDDLIVPRMLRAANAAVRLSVSAGCWSPRCSCPTWWSSGGWCCW